MDVGGGKLTRPMDDDSRPLSDELAPFATAELCTYCGCTTFIKWFEALAEYYDVPLVMIDVPYQRDDKMEEGDIKYIEGQLRELAETCAKLTGRRFDESKLSAILQKSKLAEDLWVDILRSARRRPSPISSTGSRRSRPGIWRASHTYWPASPTRTSSSTPPS